MIIEMDMEKEDTVDAVAEDEVPNKKRNAILYFFLIKEKLYID